jgi:hypothetical protein
MTKTLYNYLFRNSNSILFSFPSSVTLMKNIRIYKALYDILVLLYKVTSEQIDDNKSKDTNIFVQFCNEFL